MCYGYLYVSDGNLAGITKNGKLVYTYDYDSLGRLIHSSMLENGKAVRYTGHTYDTYGNIRSSTSSLSGLASERYAFEYGDASWTDRLTKVTYTDGNGNTEDGSLTYDRIGNPLTYFNGRENWNFTWKFGRQLTGASSGSKAVSYAYDVDGIRQSKTVNGSTTKFTTLDGKVVRETWGNITTDYFYDNEGKPYKLEISGNAMNFVGYYVLNQQGDVIAILDDAGEVAVTYEYNAWGKILDETGSGTLVSLYL